IPAVIAQMWRDTIKGRLLLGWTIALSASVAGILWSFYADYPTGPAVVMTLASFLLVSGALYYIRHSHTPARSTMNVAAMILFGALFFGTLSHFRKSAPHEAAAGVPVADQLLEELHHDEVNSQLDAISHLGDINDARIVPALRDLLSKSTNEQVVEAIAEAFTKKKDPKAVPALKAALQKNYDPFLKLTLAKALIQLNDTSGYDTLVQILKNDDAGFARAQALELIKAKAGQDFGYNAEKSVAENSAAIQKIDQWHKGI